MERNWLSELDELFRSSQVPAHEVEEYRQSLWNPAGSPKHYEKFKFETISLNPRFSRWMESNQSSLLLAMGETRNLRTDFSWLSPSAFELMDMLKNSSRNVASCFIQTSTWMEQKRESHLILTSIIWQLIESKSSAVADPLFRKDIKKAMEHPDWRQKDPKLPCQLLMKFLEIFPITYIILDRVDFCNCDLVVSLDRLLNLVRSSMATVKIFVVIDGKELNLASIDDPGPHGQFECIVLDQTDIRRARWGDHTGTIDETRYFDVYNEQES